MADFRARLAIAVPESHGLHVSCRERNRRHIAFLTRTTAHCFRRRLLSRSFSELDNNLQTAPNRETFRAAESGELTATPPRIFTPIRGFERFNGEFDGGRRLLSFRARAGR